MDNIVEMVLNTEVDLTNFVKGKYSGVECIKLVDLYTKLGEDKPEDIIKLALDRDRFGVDDILQYINGSIIDLSKNSNKDLVIAVDPSPLEDIIGIYVESERDKDGALNVLIDMALKLKNESGKRDHTLGHVVDADYLVSHASRITHKEFLAELSFAIGALGYSWNIGEDLAASGAITYVLHKLVNDNNVTVVDK